MLDKDAMREIRKERQMSRAQVAEKLERHPLTIRRWETGKAQPNSHSILALAVALGCNVEDLTVTPPVGEVAQ
ncbi:helix-turn-helix transcriptional regulator [Streptomyces adelaidensis]|uniref:helix-turn-helix transcriptional regulator n=1 Tax=Streptomyces adelaidensis TaxID=2796465 RepID=UPI0019051A90|nr:helix-turn-helix transcriptional regulator [Streptomyces adelaidensis]